MKKVVLLSLATLTIAVAIWGGFAFYRARNDLVTLNVRNAEVREVVRKIEWQTWERILVHKDVQGKVTLNVKNVPLSEVLTIIGDQTSSRWSAFYPLYSSAQSLLSFKQALRGDVDAAKCGWTNLVARGFAMRGGGGMFGDLMRGQNKLVSMNCLDQDLEIATLALARYAQARVVPEDGTAGKVRLILKQVTMPQAVEKLAKQVRRKWGQMYALQAERFGRGGDFAGGGPPFRDGMGEGRGGRGGRGFFAPDFMNTNAVADTNAWDTNAWAMAREQRRAEMQQRYEQLMGTLTPEERKQAEAMRQQFENARQGGEDFRGNPQFTQWFQNRMVGRMLNTTPEQRVDRDRQREQWRQRREFYQQGNPRR